MKPNRQTVRAKWHDYNGGEYFITICTKDREHFFGTITNGETHLSEIGSFVKTQIENVQSHYPYADIPLYVIMPNHLHLIIRIDNTKTNASRNANIGKDTNMQNVSNQQGWLSVCIGGIKSSVTKFSNEQKIHFGWQPRFHDHIIRNQDEMNRIAEYIENNPVIWETDCFYGTH